MRARTVIGFLAALLAGAIIGSMLTPPVADAVSREIIQIQQTVNQILQNQQDLRTDLDTKMASTQTLVQQSLDASNHLSQTMGALQKTLQDASANSGANNSSIAQQMQGMADNMQVTQAQVGKLAQQLTDIQNTLQQISAKVSTAPATSSPGMGTGTNPGTAPSTTSPAGPPPANTDGSASAAPPAATQPVATQPVASLPPISGDTLFSNATRDLNSANYTLAKREFDDYLKNFPDGPFASDAQFYLGELAYSQGRYAEAISAYDSVITDYPRSPKVAPAMLEKGRALIQTKKTTSAQREFRELVRRFPGTDEAKKAEAALRSISSPQ